MIEIQGIIICPYCQKNLNEKYYCIDCQMDFSTEVEFGKDGTLPDYQIAQQDNINNACFNLLKIFSPNCDWDIKQISIIRNALIDVLIADYGKKEYDLYPWLLESE